MKNNKDEHPVFNNPILKDYKCEGQLKFIDDNKNLKIVEEPKNKDKTLCKFV